MFVNYRLKVFDKSKTIEYRSKFVSGKTIVAEKYTIHLLMINVVTSLSYTQTLTVTENIILKTKSFLANFLKDRKK